MFLLPGGYLAVGPQVAEAEPAEEAETRELAWAASASSPDV